MIAIEKTKNSTGKLLVAVLAMALIVASIAIIFSTSESDAAEDKTELPVAGEDGIITIATDGSYYLTGDVNGRIVVNAGVTATLDLAGYTISYTGSGNGEKEDNSYIDGVVILVKGTLTINDSSADGTGSVVQDGLNAAAIHVSVGGTLTINAGTFKCTDESTSAYYVLKNLGTVTINGGVFENNSGKNSGTSGSSAIANGWYNGTNNTGGTDAVMTINAGTFNGYHYIKNDDYGVMNIYGGTFSGTGRGAAIMNVNELAIDDDANAMADLIINGGDNASAVLNFTIPGYEFDAGKLTIKSGTFNVGALVGVTTDSDPFGDITVGSGIGVDILSVSDVKLTGTITVGGNSISLTNVPAGSDGLTISEGSIVISGTIAADTAGAMISGTTGDVVLKDLTVTGTEAVSLSGTIAIEGKVNIENATVEDGTTITVAEDAVVNLPADVLAEMTYKDGATVIINDLEYTVYNKVLSTNLGKNVSFAVGVAISNPEYDGDEITLRDLSPQVILISVTGNEVADGDASSARFDASLTEIVNGPAVNVGTYNVVVAVELNYNGAAGNVSNYFYPTASFSIVSPEPDVTLEMDGWNVNIGYDPSTDAPTFEYILNGVTYTNETENPFTVTYTLVGPDGIEYTQDQWGSIDTAGTYTLNAVFSSWNDGNYKSVTETTNVELTAGTVESVMEFSATDLSEVYGVYVDRLQTGITVTSNDANIVVSGTVYYLASFPGFWGEADDKPGYYVVFDAVAKNLSSQSIVTVTGSGETKTLTGTEYDGYWVLYLGDISETTPTLTQQFTITYDADGEGPLYTETTYTVDLSGIISNANYPLKVILSDERNATEKIDVTYLIDQEGYLQLPNAAGDAGWLTETNVFYAAGSMVKIEDSLDVNGDGMIVFTAQYGSTPVEPGETDPATEVFVSMYYDGDKLVITVSAVEGYIPAGELTITGSYVSEVIDVPGFGLVPVVSQIPKTVVDVEKSQSVIILTPEDYGFIGSITALDVTYSADDDSLTASSNHMTFEYTVDSVTA